MYTSQTMAIRTSRRAGNPAWGSGSEVTWWAQRREASLNWLALGLLLAAWNASDGDAAPASPRPETLRGYTYVSVRAATLNSEQPRAARPN